MDSLIGETFVPKYIVTSGDFEIEIERPTMKKAACDAIGFLKKTDEQIELSIMTEVSSIDDVENIRYFATIVLMEENGIKFKLKDNHAT